MTTITHHELVENLKSKDYFAIIGRLMDGTGRMIDLLHAAFGINTEVGELFTTTDVVNLKEEIGDSAFYVELGYQSINTTAPTLSSLSVKGQDQHYYRDLVAEASVAQSELQDHVKRVLFYGINLDYTVVRKHLSKISHLLLVLCVKHGFTLEDAKEANKAKLLRRYKGGKFSEQAAINRDLAAERQELENN